MFQQNTQLEFKTLRLTDLELLLAWRSNPKIYQYFRNQDSPLTWEEHVKWFGNRGNQRFDYIIVYHGRRVGTVNIDRESNVGVLIGEVSLWGKGIGKDAIKWICDKHSRSEYYAEIHNENVSSVKLIQSCGFEKESEDGKWFVFRRDGEVSNDNSPE